MTDISTTWDIANGQGDWQLLAPHLDLVAGYTPGTGLRAGGDLETAVLISLFSDAEASPDDVIPDGSADPRGWWGGGLGSKLWLRMRSKRVPALLELVRSDIRDALQWMIDDGVAARIEATAEFQGSDRLAARVVVYRQDGTHHPMNFSWAWSA